MTLSTKKKILLSAILILVVTALSFANSLDNDFTNWDDDILVVNNPFIKDISKENIKELLSTFYKDGYRPLFVILSNMIEYKFFGLNPFYYHLDNLIFHLLSALLVFYIIYKLTSSIFVSLATGLLFGVHPLQVEAVTWISERKGVLSGLFYLLSIAFYLNYTEKDKKGLYGLSMATYLFAMLTKLMTVTLPAILILCDYLQGRKIDRRSLTEKIPFFILSAIFVFDTIFIYKTTGLMTETTGPVEGLLIASNNVFNYLAKSVAPVNLSAVYPAPAEVGLFLPAFYLPIAVLILLTIAVIYSAKFNRKVVFGSLFFLVALSPALKFISFSSGTSIMADRYMHIPSIGLFFIVSSGLGWLYARNSTKKGAARTAAVAILCLLIVVSSWLTYQRNDIWQDDYTLWMDVVKKHPDLHIARYNLANNYLAQDRYDEAISEYNISFSLYQGPPNGLFSQYNMALAYHEKGDLDNAINSYTFALNFAKEPNDIKNIYLNMGNAFVGKRMYSEAINRYNRALKAVPYDPTTLANRAAIIKSLR